MPKLILLLLLVAPFGILAQNPGPVQTTNTTPSGGCGSGVMYLVGPGGTLYTCQNGTWAQASGGSGVSPVVATFNTAMGTCTTTGGTGTNSCTATTGSIAITHNLGVSNPFTVVFNSTPADVAVTTTGTSTNVATLTFSGDLTGTARVSTGGIGATGPAGPSGGSSFPLTVSGTVNSGGIPCFNSTTNEESSATIASGYILEDGGSGACITSVAYLPISQVGSSGLSGNSPVSIASSGAISCGNCVQTTFGNLPQYSLPYTSSSGVIVGAAVNTSTADEVLVSTGTGSAGQAATMKNAPALSAANMTSFPTLNQSTSGNAATATALASSPTNCTTGQFPSGVNASGTAQNCSDGRDVHIIPFAAAPAGTAASGVSYASGQWTPTARAGSNNIGAALQAIPSTGATLQFRMEIPADWDSGNQMFVKIEYGSGANTSGTVIWQIGTACTKGDGSVSDDPSFNTQTAFASQTMATANRTWNKSGQLTTVTSGNNCVGGDGLIIEAILSGTASSALNAYQAIVTIPVLTNGGQSE